MYADGKQAVNGRAKANAMDGEKSKVADLEIELKRHQAIQLRLRGFSYREIGEQIGCSTTTAFEYVNAVLERVKKETNETAEKARQLALGRIDIAVRGLMPKVEAGDARAAEVMAKLEERRAKLIGLDAPEKHAIEAIAAVDTSQEATARHVRELFGGHAAKGPSEPTGSVPPSAA